MYIHVGEMLLADVVQSARCKAYVDRFCLFIMYNQHVHEESAHCSFVGYTLCLVLYSNMTIFVVVLILNLH